MEVTVKKSLGPEKIKELCRQAEACCRQGADYEKQGALTKAERACLEALRIQKHLLEETEDKSYGRFAGELCEILADLSMQQGNMHGADRYYVEALAFYSRAAGTGEEKNGR